MAYDRWVVDIELTNRCNALCHFCPRDRTPQQGMIDEATLERAVARVAELPRPCPVMFAGQGEPLLHPRAASFVARVRDAGLSCGMTTNASLLDRARARELLEAGLERVSFSVSDLFADYQRVYNLEFSKTLGNIVGFLELNDGRCEVNVNIVVRPDNVDKVARVRAFWEQVGIHKFNSWPANNRGGSCESDHRFLATDRLVDQARQLLRSAGGTDICSVPYKIVFVGWNGNYYICCNDYAKERPLGHVNEIGIEALDAVKFSAYRDGLEPCRKCNLEPVNAVREVLLRAQAAGAAPPARELAAVLAHWRAARELLPAWALAAEAPPGPDADGIVDQASVSGGDQEQR